MYIIRQVIITIINSLKISNFYIVVLYCVLHQLHLTKLHENIDIICPQYA